MSTNERPPPLHDRAAWEDIRTGLGTSTLKRAFLDNLFYVLGRFPAVASRKDNYRALAYTVRDRLLHRWVNTAQSYLQARSRTVVYLSAEYLLGPHLGNNLLNLGMYDAVRRVTDELGLELDALLAEEEEPGLGSGGLGRLAACFLDSLSTLQIPAIGYGIRYEFGIFDQAVHDGWQVERTDKWLQFGNPWEIAHPEIAFAIKLGGRTESYHDDDGAYRVRWLPEREVKGIAYDTAIPGYKVNTANFLRLWRAQACESFDFQAFNTGDYYGAIDEKVFSENITKVLYPNDEPASGKELRLQQQYFFVSCSLQDLIRIYKQVETSLEGFHERFVIQLNDTHPSIAIPELMRLLVDEHHMPWEQAWHITQNTFAYTNHTLLPEALEQWPVRLYSRLLPRHLEIIYEINQKFLDQARLAYPNDHEKIARLSLIDERDQKYVRMANLACVGSHAVNGVAKMHTELLKTRIFKDFYQLWPHKFSNKTNGVTPRRFILLSNPGLSELVTRKIGDGWIRNLEELKKLEELADDPDFHAEWRDVKQHNKRVLATLIHERTGVSVDSDSIFDVHAKRLHEYKRQHLNLLHIITLYHGIKRGAVPDLLPRTCVFAGKAAPGYHMAKLIIKLINSVSDVVNNDPDTRDYLKVIFLPDYDIKTAQQIYPAADLSEQISTAGTEASGTGNMKSVMNGAVIIGTPDGANVEIRDEVGAENLFLFGLTVDQIQRMRSEGYRPREIYRDNPTLREVMDLIASGFFSRGDRELFQPLVKSLLDHDNYMALADYQSYVDCQSEVDRAYAHREQWTRMSILNAARSGRFSSDRSVRQYCEEIWNVKPLPIELPDIR